MARPVYRICFFIWCFTALAPGCGNRSMDVDISGINTLVNVERFDRELFGLEHQAPEEGIGLLYEKYGDFFDVFNVHVINIGPASARLYPSYLSMFINDPINREVYEYSQQVHGGMEAVNQALSLGFSYYSYHYPDSVQPRVVGYVSRFNQGLFTVGNFVGVGLDQYLGRECHYYNEMGVPRYLLPGKDPERIPLDVMLAWATQIYPYNDSVDNVLNRMIHQGMLVYFVDAMYPGTGEHLKMGFTPDQMKWCRNNERQMWTYLVEEKLLFSTDPLVIRKLTETAPNTRYYTEESPGRAAVWQGLQIVRAYARRNQELSLHQIMSASDYQELLRQSRYDP